jgi:adenosylcobinamide kinase / adenosylcobinamide-phosphate guanylyltransferase
MIHLVLGGARSGKSRHAEHLARAHQGRKIYVATAEAFDDEMRERIAFHIAQREGQGWETVEAPLDPAAALAGKGLILVDCITVWINNLMHHEKPVRERVFDFIEKARAFKGTLIVVSNEVGLGVVPDNQLGRRFRDVAGWANQEIAKAADDVTFMAAGLPLALKKARRKPGPKPAAKSSRGRKASAPSARRRG